MTGFEPWPSGIGSDRAVNCATTTATSKNFSNKLTNSVQLFRHILTPEDPSSNPVIANFY